MITEDEFADFYVLLHLGMVNARLRRHLQLFGWPHLWQKALFDEVTACLMINRFRTDWTNFEILKDLKDIPNYLSVILKRHLFHKTSNEQFDVAVRDVDHKFHDDLRNLILRRRPNICGSNIIEEVNNYQKNNKGGEARKRHRRPLASMYQAVKSKVLDERYKYMTVNMDAPMLSKKRKLTAEHFTYTPNMASLNFSEIVSTKQAPTFFSPCAQNNMLPTADIYMLRETYGHNDRIKMADVGEICDYRHRFIFQEKANVVRMNVISHFMYVAQLNDLVLVLVVMRLNEEES